MIYVDRLNDDIIYYKDKNTYGTGYPSSLIEDDNLIITQDMSLQLKFKERNISYESLSNLLRLPENMTLYDIFSFYFSGKVKDDFDMLVAIFNGLLVKSNKNYYCLKIGATFCWFYIENNKIFKLGKIQFSHVNTKYNIGNFVKQLYFKMAMSGVNINNVRYLIWNDNDMDNEFKSYLNNYRLLSSFFADIKGIVGMSCLDIYKFIDNEISFCVSLTADKFVDSLSNISEEIKLEDSDGSLKSNNIFYKDYSILECKTIDYKKCSFGVILDCEGFKGSDGSLSNGISEMGGIIYCIYNNTLINVDSFSCDYKMLDETLKMVFNNYKRMSKSQNINIIVYGSSDQKMFFASYRNKSRFTLNFINAEKYIKNFLGVNSIKLEKVTLTNIAKSMYVMPLYPKHKPLNDARTLFNIIAKIYYITGQFII